LKRLKLLLSEAAKTGVVLLAWEILKDKGDDDDQD